MIRSLYTPCSALRSIQLCFLIRESMMFPSSFTSCHRYDNNSYSYNNGFGCLHALLCSCNIQCNHNLSFDFTCCRWWLFGSLLPLLGWCLHRSLILRRIRHLHRYSFNRRLGSDSLRLYIYIYILFCLWFCF